MSKLFPINNNFTSGKLSPIVQARDDTKAYSNGLKECENFIVMPHGGLVRRGGFKYIADAEESENTSRLIPFMFSTSPKDSYILEFNGLAGSEKIRIFKSDGTELTAQEIDASAWFDAADIPNIRYAQSADVMYFVDGAHEVWKLTRSGTAESPIFALTQSNLVGTPYSSASKRLVKIFRMTADLWRSWGGTNATNYSNTATFEALFNQNDSNITLLKTTELEDTTYGIMFGDPISDEDKYNNKSDTWEDFFAYQDEFDLTHTGSTYNYSFEINSHIYAHEADTYYFALNCDTMGNISVDEEEVVSTRGTIVAIIPKDLLSEFGINSSIKLTQGSHPIKTRFTVNSNGDLTPANWGVGVAWRKGHGPYYNGTSVNGTGNALLTYSYDVDLSDWHGNTVFEIKIKASPDGTKFGWTWREMTTHPEDMTADWPDESVQITEWNVKSPTGWAVKPTDGDGAAWKTDSGDMYELKSDPSSPTYLFGAFYMPSGTQIAEDSWVIRIGFQPIPSSWFRTSPTAGDAYYPSAITFHQNRMYLAGFSQLPLVRASVVGDFENFKTGSNASDALEFTIASSKIDTIQWIKSGRKLVIGTTGTEYIVDAQSGVIMPEDISVTPHTYYGSDFVDPVQIDNNIIFAEKNGIRLRDYSYHYDIDGYSGDDVSIISYEEIKDGIKELVYQQAGLVGYKGALSISLPPINLIWVLTDEGELKGITYEKQHNVIAWHEHDVGTGALIDSIAVIPGTDGTEQLWALIRRLQDDEETYIRYIERLGQTIEKDLDGHDNEVSFTATAETLPVLYDNEGQTIRQYKKRYVNINGIFLAGGNVSVAEGSETFSTDKQAFTQVTGASGVEDIEAPCGTGWEKDLTLVIKSEQDGDGASYPCVLLGIHGKVIVNAP